jgi:large subunit ribosomal protein L10
MKTEIKSEKKHTAHVSKEKKNLVEEIKNLLKEKRTCLIVSIKNIPASQFQEITKKLRGKAIIKVPRKNLIFKALEFSEEEKLRELEPKIKENIALLFSDEDSFKLAAEIIRNKSPARANPGQEAPEDIEVPEGPTDLLPGPAMSELSSVGIKIQIEKGKISIKEAKIVAKKGEKISQAVADVLTKLDIKPFYISLIPLAAYDSKEKKVYLNIDINIEKNINNLKEAYSKALPFAVEIGYVSKDTIRLLIQKAGRHELALKNLTDNTPQKNEGGN